MKLKEICEKLGYEYDNNRGNRILENIRKEYLIEQTSPNHKDYIIVRPLTDDEKLNIGTLSKLKPFLKQYIVLYMKYFVDATDGVTNSVEKYLSQFKMVNDYFRLFLYEGNEKRYADFLETVNINEAKLKTFASAYAPILKRVLADTLRELSAELIIESRPIDMKVVKTLVYVDDEGMHFRHESMPLTPQEIGDRNDYRKILMNKVKTLNLPHDRRLQEDLIKKYDGAFEHERRLWETLDLEWYCLSYEQQMEIDKDIARIMGYVRFSLHYQLIPAPQNIEDYISSNKVDKTLFELQRQMNFETIKKIINSTSKYTEEISIEDRKDCIKAFLPKE